MCPLLSCHPGRPCCPLSSLGRECQAGAVARGQAVLSLFPRPWAGGQLFPLSSCRKAACRIHPCWNPHPWGPPSLLAFTVVHLISKDCPVSALAWFCVALILRRPERLQKQNVRPKANSLRTHPCPCIVFNPSRSSLPCHIRMTR